MRQHIANLHEDLSLNTTGYIKQISIRRETTTTTTTTTTKKTEATQQE
jgi:hypothetical protein